MIWSIRELRRGGDKVLLQISVAQKNKIPVVRGTITTMDDEIGERMKWKEAVERMNSGNA